MKRTKKLMAMLLALAMALSCCVSAMASGATVSGDERHTTQSGGAFKDVISGGVISEAELESRRPADVIRMVMPTQTAGDFDMILDPHDLIQESQESGKMRVTSGDFLSGTLVYFRVPAADAGTTKDQYSATSVEKKIINKSSVPVSVDVEAAVVRSAGGSNYVQSGDDFKLGADTFKLVNSINKTTSDPQMVLTLVSNDGGSSDTSAKITTPSEIGAPVLSAASLVKDIKVVWANSLGANYKEGVNKEIASGLSLTLTPSKAGTPSSTDLNKITASVASVSSGGKFELDSTGTVLTTDDWNSSTLTATHKTGDTLTMSFKLKVLASQIADPASTTSGDTLAAAEVATITVTLDNAAVQAVMDATSAPSAVNVSARSWTLADSEKQSALAHLDKLEGSYTTQYKNGAYEYVLGEEYENDKDSFESFSFKLTAEINGKNNGNEDAWDALFSANRTKLVDINVIWDVVPLKGVVDDKDPKATVKTKASAVNDNVVISYSLGTGAKASAGIDSLTFQNGANTVTIPTTAYTLDESAKTITFKAFSALFNSGKVTVKFKAAGSNPAAEPTLDIK